METQKTIRKKIYEFIKSKGAIIDDKSKEELKALLTEYKDYFLNLNETPPKKAAPKEVWKTYSTEA